MKKLAPVFVFLAGVLWGCMGLYVRGLNVRGLESMNIAAVRSMVTCVAVFIYMIIFKRNLLKIKLKDIWCFVGTGVCSVMFFNFCYFKAITITSLSIAAILLYTAPAIVMVLSCVLFKEKITSKKIIAIIMTFIGCVLVTGVIGDTESLSLIGVLTGLGAGFGYALYSIFGRYALERGYNSLTITFYTFLFSTLGTSFFADLKKVGTVMTGDSQTFMLCIALGLLGTVAPYVLYTLGLTYIENSKASIIASVEPVTATLVGFMFFKESLSGWSIAGILLVLFALVVCNVGEKN